MRSSKSKKWWVNCRRWYNTCWYWIRFQWFCSSIIKNCVISENICSLNEKQWQLFEVIHKLYDETMWKIFLVKLKNIKSLHIFLTVVLEPHIKTIYMSISKVLMYNGGHPEKPRILLLAPLMEQQFILH